MIFSNSESKAEAGNYDPRKRDPLYAHATHSPLWELVCSLSLSSPNPSTNLMIFHIKKDTSLMSLPPYYLPPHASTPHSPAPRCNA